MRCIAVAKALALAQEFILGKWLFEVISPGGQIWVCIRFDISDDGINQEAGDKLRDYTYWLI